MVENQPGFLGGEILSLKSAAVKTTIQGPQRCNHI